jgi:hypothetical protein
VWAEMQAQVEELTGRAAPSPGREIVLFRQLHIHFFH